jgi:prepilin-type N-terminal cleavage/methylation domain-containing protein
MIESNNFRASRGVTLIELLVVLVILAIAVSLAAPSLINAAEKFGLSSAGRQIVSTIRSARNEAKAKQQELLATFAGGELIVDHGEGKQNIAVHLPEGVRISPESIPASYTLLPSGQILGPQRLELILNDRYRVFVVLGPGPGTVKLEGVR